MPDLVSTVLGLREREVGFCSLTEGIDTTSAAGRFMLVVLAGLAEMERELMRERTIAGLAAARARGRSGGRPWLMSPGQAAHGPRNAPERTAGQLRRHRP